MLVPNEDIDLSELQIPQEWVDIPAFGWGLLLKTSIVTDILQQSEKPGFFGLVANGARQDVNNNKLNSL